MNRRSRKFTSRGEARSHSSHDSEDGQNVSGSRRSEVQRKRFGLRRMPGGMLQDHSLVPTQSTKSNTSNGQGCLRTTLLPEVLISKAGGNFRHPSPMIKKHYRECTVESGVSHHMMGRSSLQVEEKKTVRATRKAYSIQTANGIIEATQKAEANVIALSTYVVVTLVEDSPAVTLGKDAQRCEFLLHLDTRKGPDE